MATKVRHRRVKKRPTKPQPKIPPKNKQLFIRTSERSSFQSCQHAWQWGWIETRKPIQEGPQLRFGSLIHLALEKRYPPGLKRGPHPAKTFKRLYKKHTAEAYEMGFRDEDGDWQNLGDVGVDMMENYVDHFGDDSEWEVLASEMTFQVPVFEPCSYCSQMKRTPPCPKCGNSGLTYLFTYVGTLDGVWRNRIDGGVRINDYKTTGHDPEQEIQNVGYTGALGLQPGAYWSFGVDFLRSQRILSGGLLEALDGMVFTYLRKAMRDDRPQDEDGHYLNTPTKAALLRRAEMLKLTVPKGAKVEDLINLIGDDAYLLGEVSKSQPPPLIHREVTYRSEQQAAKYRERAIRQVKKMIELRNGPAEDREKDPHWLNCRMCGFKDACELHELDSNWEDFLDGSTQQWEPYSAHEIEEEGRK